MGYPCYPHACTLLTPRQTHGHRDTPSYTQSHTLKPVFTPSHLELWPARPPTQTPGMAHSPRVAKAAMEAWRRHGREMRLWSRTSARHHPLCAHLHAHLHPLARLHSLAHLHAGLGAHLQACLHVHL